MKGGENKMTKEISVEEYKKLYNKIISGFAQKDFSNETKIITLVFGAFIVGFALLSILVEPILIVGVFVFIALMLFFITASYIKNNYDFEIKKEFTDIEKLKKEYRKLIKEKAKKNLFIISGIYVFIFLFLLLIFYLLYTITDNDSIFVILSIVGVFMGHIALIFSEINFYKNKISEEQFKKIEAKVGDEVRS